MAELADRLGYRSEAAFARAFKRVTGVAPGSIKRQAGPEIGAIGLPVAGRRPAPPTDGWHHPATD